MLAPNRVSAQIKLLEIYLRESRWSDALKQLQYFLSHHRPFIIPLSLRQRFLTIMMQLKIAEPEEFFSSIRELRDKEQEEHIDRLKGEIEEIVKIKPSDNPEQRALKVRAMMQMYDAKLTSLYQLFWLNKNTLRAGQFSERPRLLKEELKKQCSKPDSHIECRACGDYYRDLGVGFRKLAIEGYTAALRTNPNPEIYRSRGALYADRGDSAQAAADFNKAVQLETETHASGRWFTLFAPRFVPGAVVIAPSVNIQAP
jgi:tetratricopeptide (TPR) repeat protein